MKPIPILYLITELSVGGAQTVLLHLLTHLNRERFTPVVVCLYNGDGATAKRIKALGIPVIDVQMTRKYNVFALGRVSQLIRKYQPTIIHASLFHTNILARLLSPLTGTPIVISTEQTMNLEGKLRHKINRFTAPLVDKVVANADNVQQFYANQVGIPSEKLVLIYDGVKTSDKPLISQTKARERLGLPLDSLIFGTIGRIDPVKGLDVLIQALPKIDEGMLVLVGKGPDRSRLEALSKKLNLADKIHWAGYQSDVFEVLPAFDIFIQSSFREGLPSAILEAMSAGLPIIATTVGGTPEIVKEMETGLLVPPNDSGALATAINHLAKQPQLQQQMGQKGMKRIEKNFTLPRMISQYEQLYDQLLTQ